MSVDQGQAGGERLDWFNMSAFAAAGRLRVTDPRVAALSATRLAVLVWAASFAALNDPDPKLFASASKLADRCGLGLRTVKRELHGLCDDGLLEHTGKRITGERTADGGRHAGPVIYRQTALAEALAEPRSATAARLLRSPRSAAVAREESATVAREESAALARPNQVIRATPGEQDDDPLARGEVDAASASAAGGPPADGESALGGIDDEIMTALGYTRAAAEKWRHDKLDGRRVGNQPAYLRRCIEQERAQLAAPPKTAGAAKTARHKEREQLAAVAAALPRCGGSWERVAAELSLDVYAVLLLAETVATTALGEARARGEKDRRPAVAQAVGVPVDQVRDWVDRVRAEQDRTCPARRAVA